ncbi:MAG: hypothetical protein MRQ09_02210 [Candidatus Midichloria sp.]|nr:hypothetical protein [Candidatus Midichloria sp.]
MPFNENNKKSIIIDQNFIKDLLLRNTKSTTLSSDRAQLSIEIEIQNPDLVREALTSVTETEQLLQIFRENNLKLWIDRGLKKDNTIAGIPSIVVEAGLNRFFDIKEKYGSREQLEYYLFQEETEKSPEIRIELFNQSLFGEPTVRYFPHGRTQNESEFIDQEIPNITDFVFQKGKEGGATDGGKEGGIYKRTGNTYLIKQENTRYGVSNHSNISEYLAGQIFAKIAPGYGAEIELVSTLPRTVTPDQTGENVYVASKFFNNYKDLYVHAYESMDLPAPAARPRNVGTINRRIFEQALARDNHKYYRGFPQAMVTSLLVADYDIHWGNIGVVSENGQNKMVRIDFGWAFKKLTPKLNPHSIIEHLPGFGPTNHFREYPNEMKITQEFADELRRVAIFDLTECLESSFHTLKQFYGAEPLREFAYSIGIEETQAVTTQDKDALSKLISTFLSDRLKNRQKEMRLFAVEIELSLCVDINKKDFDMKKVEEFVKNNTEYCKGVVEGNQATHLRTTESKNFFIELLEMLGIIKPLAKVLEAKIPTVIQEAMTAQGIPFDAISKKENNVSIY